MVAKSFEWPDYPCPKCGWKSWEVVKCKNQGGSIQYLYMCNCGHRTMHYIPKKVVEAAGIEVREVEPRQPRPKCEVCGADGAENHHWAPFHIFGGECDKWPQSFLCPPCHKRWHDLVTPNANGTRKANPAVQGTLRDKAARRP